MKLIRYQVNPVFEPVANVSELQEDMSRLFDLAFPVYRRFVGSGFPGGAGPALDLYENEDAYQLQAEVPGWKKEELKIEIADGGLTLRGERAGTASSPEDRDVAREAVDEHFRRTLTLPKEVAVDRVKAVCENGILTVTLPKKEAARPQRLTIEVK